jgi:hypothetical protein
MPSTVTAFAVKIASPGDAGMELFIAREVIGEWNALHALEQKRVLIPLAEADAGSTDLLIAIFCAAKGTPDASSSPGIELAIEKQLEAKRPVLIYFSEGRADLGGINVREARVLEEFKKRFESRASLDSFSDEKEFRAKFARQLDLTVSSHAHFRIDSAATEAVPAFIPASIPEVAPHDPSIAELSPPARELLSEACDDPEAYIGRLKDASGLKLQANGRQFVPQGDPAAMARWENAFGELIAHGLIRDAGCKGRLFQISTKGFEYLKSIGKSPVGYIAELGGM